MQEESKEAPVEEAMENLNVEEEEKKEADNTAHEESEFAPTEVTPVQEKIEVVNQFKPTSFAMLAGHWKQPEMLGRGKNGHMLAKLDGKIVYIEEIEMNLQVLEKFNESPYVCKVVACLETSRTDP